MLFFERSQMEKVGVGVAAAVRWIAQLPLRILSCLATWRRNAMYLRELERMDPRLLKDVGYRRDEVIQAVREGRAAMPMTDEERMEETRKQSLATRTKQRGAVSSQHNDLECAAVGGVVGRNR